MSVKPLRELVKLYERAVDKENYRRADLLQDLITVAIEEAGLP